MIWARRVPVSAKLGIRKRTRITPHSRQASGRGEVAEVLIESDQYAPLTRGEREDFLVCNTWRKGVNPDCVASSRDELLDNRTGDVLIAQETHHSAAVGKTRSELTTSRAYATHA